MAQKQREVAPTRAREAPNGWPRGPPWWRVVRVRPGGGHETAGGTDHRWAERECELEAFSAPFQPHPHHCGAWDVLRGQHPLVRTSLQPLSSRND